MRSIYIVLDYYFNGNTANSNCLLEIAKTFAELEYDVKLINYNDANKGILNSNLNIYKNISITNLNYCKRFSNRTVVFCLKILNKIYRFFSCVNFNLFYIYTVKEYLIKCLKNDDVVIFSVFPSENFYVSQYIRRKACNVKIFLMLFDEFSNHPNYFKNSILKKHAIKIAANIENCSIKNCDLAFYIDNWKKYFFYNCAKKYINIAPPLLVNNSFTATCNDDIECINIMYAGNIDFLSRSPMTLLCVIDYILSKNSNVFFNFFGKGNCINLVNELAKKYIDNVVNHGMIDRVTLQTYYNNSNVLVVIGNTYVEMVPSKIYECMSTCKPIVYFYTNIGDYAYNELAKYPLIYFYKQGDMSINSIDNLYKWILSNCMKRVDYSYLKEVFFYASPQYVVENIIKYIRGANE